MNKTICIIPARKGSKRIKNKNTVNFFGKPIIQYTLENLKKFKRFEKIIVSTNCKIIKKIAQKQNAEVLIRSEKLSNDTTDTSAVIVDAINKLEKKNFNFDKILCVYPTSIFFKSTHLKLAFKKLKKDTPFVFSAKKFTHPIERSFFRDKNGRIKFNFKFDQSVGTQNYNENFHDAGQFYLGWKDSWLSKKRIFDPRSKFIIFDFLKSHDLDCPDDLKVAKKLYKLEKK